MALPGITGIDPASWQVRLLPLPKKFTRGAALGFCDGHPAGRVENARAKTHACWWPDATPRLLELAGRKDPQAGRAGGSFVPGHWRNANGSMGAVQWRAGQGVELHDKAFASTWATAAGGGAVVGMGTPKRKAGARTCDVGLVWRDGRLAATIEAGGEVALHATDGIRVAGAIDGRATWWPAVDAAPVDLAPPGHYASEVQDLDGDLQVGNAWKGLCARAGLWRGDAASFVDLTPAGFATARAHAGLRGWQVGLVRAKDTTRNGSSACDDRAVLWQGAPDRWFDLCDLLPAPFNASVAWALAIVGDELHVCGEASRVEASDPGTPRESHFVPQAVPVLWTARLGG